MLRFHGLSVIHLHTSVDNFIKQFKRGHAISNKLGEYSQASHSGSILVHFNRGICYFVNQMHQNYLSWGKVAQDMKSGGRAEGLKVIKSFDIRLSDRHIFMQQTPPPKTWGRLCSPANQFPTPTHSSHSARGLDPAAAIAPSPSWRADLWHRSAQRSALAALPSHLRTKLCFLSVSFGFSCLVLFWKGNTSLPFFHCTHFPELWTPWITEMSLSDSMQTATNVRGCFVTRPPLPVIYWCSPQLRLKCWHFQWFESAQRSFILHRLKAHLQHAFDIRVTLG